MQSLSALKVKLPHLTVCFRVLQLDQFSNDFIELLSKLCCQWSYKVLIFQPKVVVHLTPFIPLHVQIYVKGHFTWDTHDLKFHTKHFIHLHFSSANYWFYNCQMLQQLLNSCALLWLITLLMYKSQNSWIWWNSVKISNATASKKKGMVL